MTSRERVEKIIELLEEMYPDASCTLTYKDPLQLMVATQLAAQCTDARVNIVTKELFKKYRTVQDFASADAGELEQDIKSTGFYRNKAKNIIAACKMIIDNFGGNVPGDMESLLKLPGVGRKTANLLLNDSFGIPGVVVDTHAARLSKRMGLTKNDDPEKIEYDLMEIIPKEKWGSFCHQLVYHGRAICGARKPACEKCRISPHCEYAKENGVKPSQ
ncbi:MAG: endonuclease III [Bacillota bacterium]